MKISPIIAWYDLWVGAFWDRRKRRLYILPLPCIGVVIQFREPSPPPEPDRFAREYLLEDALKPFADAYGVHGGGARDGTEIWIADNNGIGAEKLKVEFRDFGRAFWVLAEKDRE